MRKKVILVGAGPVGLWTSIQMKVLDPSLQIIHFQKYKEYQRMHVLYIDFTSFGDMQFPSDKALRKRYEYFLEQLKEAGKVNKTMLIIKTGVSLRTSVLQQNLKAFALQLGIKINFEEVKNVNQLIRQHKPDVLIGADGSHSIVRKQLFEDNLSTTSMQYTVQFKCQMHGDQHHVTDIAKDYYTLKITNYLCVVFSGKANQKGNLPVSLRLFVEKQDYDSIQATFKKPLTIQDMEKESFPKKLRDDFVVWLNLLKKRDIMIIKGTQKITKVQLTSYHSQEYAKVVQGVKCFLVGDAAAGFPYLRALNAGLILGSLLGRIVANNNPLQQFRYNVLAKTRVLFEDQVAKAKNNFLNFSKVVVKINAFMPSFFKWNDKEKEQLKKEQILKEGWCEQGMQQIPNDTLLPPPNFVQENQIKQ